MGREAHRGYLSISAMLSAEEVLHETPKPVSFVSGIAGRFV
jgi:hypothetical protein